MSGLIMIGVWWVGRWGSPTPLHRSDVYHRTHYATLLSRFEGFLLERRPHLCLLRPAGRPPMASEKVVEVQELVTTSNIQLFVYTNNWSTNYMARTQCSWAHGRDEGV